MNKNVFWAYFFLIIIASGCTQTSNNRESIEDAEAAAALNLSILASDDMQIRRSTLFSGEMTKLTLNLINLAEVYFNNIKAILINADDLNPVVEYDYIEFIQPNRSNSFEWELTAPRLGVGEILVLNDIKARIYYETYSTALKTIIMKAPGNREYASTYSESSKSPIKLYFDTSYETLTTLPNNQLKNFTVNMILYNEYIGVVDYYDNSYYLDNYIKQLVLAVPKELIFYDALDANSPWKKITEDTLNYQRFNVDIEAMDFYDYYYIEFNRIEDFGEEYGFSELCKILLMGENELNKTNPDTGKSINDLKNEITQQRRVLWMTKGYTKINVLRFGARTVNFDTEVNLKARIDYSYSQDFGGNGFGAIIYGMG